VSIELKPLPRGWRWAPLGEVLTQRNDIVHPKDGPVGSARFVGLEHIQSGTGQRLGETFVDLAKMPGRRARFRAGDIVYGYLRPYLNKVWIAEFEGLCSVDQYVYMVNREIADTEFVAAYLRSGNYLSLAPIKETPGQLPRIRTDEVAATPIPLPGISEQRRIVAALKERRATLDLAIEAAGTQLNELDRLQSRTTWLAIEEIWGRHDSAPLSSMLAERPQYGLSVRARPNGEGLGMLKMNCIDEGTLRTNDLDRIEDESCEPSGYVLEPGDILFNRTNSAELVGKSAVFRGAAEPITFASYLIRLKCNRKHEPDYICEVLNSHMGRAFIERAMGRAIGQVNVSASKLAAFELPDAPLAEQRTLVASLTDCRKAIEAARATATAQLAELTALESALLRAAFSGVL
jgi:type I restriction enzyme S subunit